MSDTEQNIETGEEMNYTNILIVGVLILIIFLLIWYFSSGDVSYSPLDTSFDSAKIFDVSTAFDIVS